MKFISILLTAFLLQGDLNFDYSLITTSWMKRSYENENTGILTFKTDSTAQLEIRKGISSAVLRKVNGSYKILRSKGQLTVDFNGKQKTYKIEDLSEESVSLKNVSNPSESLVMRKFYH